jgi:hypothetical protein
VRCLAILLIVGLVCYGVVNYTPNPASEPPPPRTGRYFNGVWQAGHFETTPVQPNGSIGYRWVPESEGPESGSVPGR